MTEEEQKELYEWYKKVEDYDSFDEDVKVSYPPEIEERIKNL